MGLLLSWITKTGRLYSSKVKKHKNPTKTRKFRCVLVTFHFYRTFFAVLFGLGFRSKGIDNFEFGWILSDQKTERKNTCKNTAKKVNFTKKDQNFLVLLGLSAYLLWDDQLITKEAHNFVVWLLFSVGFCR